MPLTRCGAEVSNDEGPVMLAGFYRYGPHVHHSKRLILAHSACDVHACQAVMT